MAALSSTEQYRIVLFRRGGLGRLLRVGQQHFGLFAGEFRERFRLLLKIDVLLLHEREGQHERIARSRRVEEQMPLVQLGQGAGHRQSDACSGSLPRAVDAEKGFENLFAQVYGYLLAVARHADREGLVVVFERHLDFVFGVLQRVVQQVAHDLGQRLAVGCGLERAFAGAERQAKPPFLDGRLETLDDALQLHRNVETHEVEPHLVRIDVAEVEQLADQLQQALCVFVDDMQVLLQLRVGVHLHDVLQRPLDERQGRPDLVGDFGEEVDFGSVQLLLLLGLEQPLLFEYLLAFASQVVAESGGGASGDDEQVGDLGQPRAPPRRADDDLQRPFRALPAAVAVDGPDAERVVARLKLGEGDRT